jgi:hypothetical protein
VAAAFALVKRDAISLFLASFLSSPDNCWYGAVLKICSTVVVVSSMSSRSDFLYMMPSNQSKLLKRYQRESQLVLKATVSY